MTRGRPRVPVDLELVRAMRQLGASWQQIEAATGCSRGTLRDRLRRRREPDGSTHWDGCWISHRDCATESVRSLIGQLRACEWVGDEICDEPSCPSCLRWRRLGHAPSCKLAAVLSRYPG